MRYLKMLLIVPILAGCYAKERKAAADEIVQLKTQVTQLTAVQAAKDTLVLEFNEASKFIDQMNAEISKLRKAPTPKPGAAGDIPSQSATEYRASVLARMKQINTALVASEAKLKVALAKVDSLSTDNEALHTQIGRFEQMVASLQGVVDQQKRDLAMLADTVSTWKVTSAKLGTEKAVLIDTVSALTTRENTVYYIVGTKKDLLAQGLVAEEGGNRALLFIKTGKTLAPARELDATKFTAIDRRSQLTIDLPDDKAKYKLVSRQNPLYLDTQPDKDGKYTDKLVIRDPASFWAALKYLIVVVD